MSHPETIGAYRILELIATGGMAAVYRARLPELHDKDLALKVIRPEVAGDPEVRRMFISEARVALALSHSHVVQTFEVAQHEGGIVFAMEYVDGLDVARLTHSHARVIGEPLPTRHVISIAAEALLGLDYAHRSKDGEGAPLDLVHRDISPGNILVSRAGEVKVADFGVAQSQLRAHQSFDGMIKGKIAYMSPEQVAGNPIDLRTDIYAMGVVLYEMLTSKRPFPGSTIAIVPEVIGGVFPRPSEMRPGVPQPLEDIVLKAMAVDPRARYQTAHDMSEALQDAAIELKAVPSLLELGGLVDRLATPARQTIPPSGPGADVTSHETPAAKREPEEHD